MFTIYMHMIVREETMTTATRSRAGDVSLNPGKFLRLSLDTEATPAQTVVRLALGLVIFPHGAQHALGWFGGYGFAGTVGWMTGELGIPLPFAVLAVVTELIAPLALVAGLGGRLAGLGIAALMAVAASTHAANGFFMNWVGSLPAGAEGYEYHLLALAMGLAVAIGGSGAWSLDRWVMSRLGEIPRRTGSTV
jgi:putative oxidoreductase